MSKTIQKGIQILNRYFSSFPQPEAFHNFGASFLLEYTSTNPSTNSKKNIKKVYIPENTYPGLHNHILSPQTLKYEEKPNRVEVNGTWEGWLIDQKLHKDLLQDPLFGTAKKNPQGNRWTYVAKVEPQKTKSYFNAGEGNLELIHDYGEGHSGKTHNGIFVYDFLVKKTFKIPNEGNLIVSNPVFLTEDGTQIIFHAYHREHFGFGFVHCFNRAVSLYIATQDGDQYKVQKLKTQTRTNMFPSVSKCGNYLAYFSGNGRTHCFYMNITVLKKEGDKWTPYHEIKDFFIGSYFQSKIYFYEYDGKPYFLCQTNEKASNVIYTFSIEQKLLRRFTDNKPGENYSIVSFDDKTNLLAVKYSTPTTVTFAYTHLPQPLKLIHSEAAGQFECESLEEPIPHFVLRKKGAEGKQPLVILIHGGPHGYADPTLSASKYLFLQSGYTILIPNYSGSVGYGQKHLENALGKIGETEGNEIVKCVERLVSQNKVDPNKVFSYGGSYGGYMGGILAGKFHEHITGAVLLNPVLSLPFMIATSDIPDWVLVEGLNRQDSLDHLTAEDYSHLYNASPIANIPQVPIAVFVGAKDRRVPHQAAKLYVSMAKGKGNRAELYLYPESDHKLSDSTETEIDVLLKAYKFIEEVKKVPN